MPEFKTHLAAGAAVGGAAAAWGMMSHDLNLVHAVAVAVLGTTGGLLPNLDSDSGKPLSLMFQLISILLPVLLLPYAWPYIRLYIRPGSGKDIPFFLCYYTVSYLLIHYGIMPVVKRFTKHRGMMHSLPFAVVAGEAAFLLLRPSGMTTAIYGGLAVMSACLVHLILDDLASASLGNSLKMKGPHLAGTLAVYAMMVGLGIEVTVRLLPVFRPFLKKILDL